MTLGTILMTVIIASIRKFNGTFKLLHCNCIAFILSLWLHVYKYTYYTLYDLHNEACLCFKNSNFFYKHLQTIYYFVSFEGVCHVAMHTRVVVLHGTS